MRFLKKFIILNLTAVLFFEACVSAKHNYYDQIIRSSNQVCEKENGNNNLNSDKNSPEVTPSQIYPADRDQRIEKTFYGFKQGGKNSFGSFFDEVFGMKTRTKYYSSRASANFIGILDSLVGSVISGATIGGIASLLAKEKGRAFRNWSFISFSIYFPLTSINAISTVEPKKLVRYKGEWVDPVSVHLVKVDNMWVDQEELMQMHWEVARAANTIAAYEEFLRNHPSGKLADQARIRLELYSTQRDWQIARTTDTIPAYEEFLSKHPSGGLADQARIRLEELYSIQRDWQTARAADTISAYEEFLSKHPSGELADQARIQLELYSTQRDWQIARTTDTIPAYEEFLSKHPSGELADQARLRAEAMRKELPDWRKALKENTVEAYTAFLKRHPNSPFAEKAQGKIVDLEVSSIMGGEHGKLPSSNKISDDSSRNYSVLNIHNNTSYNLTIRYSGQESFKVIFSPGEKGSLEVLRGNYRVAASVDAANVKNYAGEMTSDGGNYQVTYYIEITGPYEERIYLPKIYYMNSKFEPWPNKRKVADYLK